MFLDNLIPSVIGALAAPHAFIKRLVNSDMVSFGLLANLQAMRDKKIISHIDTIVDIGANHGQFAFMAHTVWPKLPIYSFEPDPDSFVQLQKSFREYNIPGQVFNLGLGAEQSTLALHRYRNHVNNSFLTRTEQNDCEAHEQINVPCTSLDKMSTSLPKANAILLKLDVQGFELAVLQGASSFLKDCRYVLAEVSFSSSYANGAHADEVMTALRQQGFECIQLLDILRDKKSGHIIEADILFKNRHTDSLL